MALALLSLDITPKTPADRQKLARALQVLAAEDDQLEVRPGAEPDCTVIGATSEAHLEQIIDRLRREFEVEARVGTPTVAYLETVTQSAEGSGKHVRMARLRGVRSRLPCHHGPSPCARSQPDARYTRRTSLSGVDAAVSTAFPALP